MFRAIQSRSISARSSAVDREGALHRNYAPEDSLEHGAAAPSLWPPINRVSILIVSYNSLPDVGDCLNAIFRSSYREFSVFICENGTQTSYLQIEEYLRATFAESDRPAKQTADRTIAECLFEAPEGQKIWLGRANSNLGYAGGVNVCIEAARALEDWDAVWILNPDAYPERGALSALVARGGGAPFAAIGCRLVLGGSNEIQMYGGFWRQWIGRGKSIGRRQSRDAVPNTEAIERQQQFVSGAAFFASRAFVDAAGPMDERFFLFNEELDWCFRRGNLPLLYEHSAVIVHSHGASIGSSSVANKRSPLAVYLEERNKLLFTRKHFSAKYPVVVGICFILCHQYLIKGSLRGYINALRGWKAGVRGEQGKPDEASYA